MKTWQKLTVAGAAVALVGTATLAGGASAHSGWDGDRPGMGRMMAGRMGPIGRGGPGAVLQKFDLDGDGKITRKEALEARAKQLEKYDSNGDGTLTLKEYERLWLDVTRPMMVRRFQMHDADGDGKVTRDEFGAIVARMFWRLDRNGDGVIDRDEMHRMGRWMRKVPERRHDRHGDNE